MNKQAKCLYVYWFVSRPFLSDHAVARARSHGYRNLFIPCRVCSDTDGVTRASVLVLSGAHTSGQTKGDSNATAFNATILPPKSKTKNRFFSRSRFRELLINSFLLSLSFYLLTRPTPEDREFKFKSTLCGRVIFEGVVSRQTQVIVPVWVGDWPNQTQTVAYTQWKDLWKYEQKPKDNYGWVW